MSGEARDSSFAGKLVTRFGKDADPSVCLDAMSLALTGHGGTVGGDEVLERLLRGGGERYETLGEIARGGMGRVDRVWDRDLRRELAMKLLLEQGEPARAAKPAPPGGGHPATVRRFVAEAQITSQLAHPGIIPVHEIGLDAAGRVYFTMQLVRGHTFEEVIRWVWERHPEWNFQRALRVVLNVCDAVAYAHSRGVIHRDLKPSNVMVGGFGETYVMDWGLARTLRERGAEAKPGTPATRVNLVERSMLDSTPGWVVGTPSYMAPEQAGGTSLEATTRSDVYAVGALLYHLLSGQRPYQDEDERVPGDELLARVRAGPPRPLRLAAPAAPPELVAICERAMRRDPAERYADMGAMAADVRAYLDQRVVRAYRTGAWAELSTWVRRNRGMAAAAGVALAATLAGLGSTLWVKTRKNDELARAHGDTQRRFDEMRRLAALKSLHDLEQKAGELWPAWPAALPQIEAWLAEARRLIGEQKEHERTRDELAARASAVDPGSAQPRFSDPTDAWWYESLLELLHGLDAVAAPDDHRVGTLAEMERRAARARTIRAKSVDAYATEWSDAIGAIAESPRYAGLELVEQTGLVPVGPDPDSGLFEFCALETGEVPERDAASGRLNLTDTTGVVLVLLPAAPDYQVIGGFEVKRGVDAVAMTFFAAPLDPFFLSKYEMTQGQWLAVTGSNPSIHRPRAEFCSKSHPLTTPVDTVSYADSLRVLSSVGLTLPTGAQWQYGARGGTDTPWWTGAREESLERAGNVRDAGYMRAHDVTVVVPSARWDDGFACAAPVGSFRPNAYGFFDTIGNVQEHCLDRLPPTQDFDAHFAPATGEWVVDRVDERQRGRELSSGLHGGSWRTSHLETVGHVIVESIHIETDDGGVRPARPLER